MDILTPIPEPSPERRRVASSRLRNLTAGVAVAGVAATAGFAVLASNGFTGTANAPTSGGASSSGSSLLPDRQNDLQRSDGDAPRSDFGGFQPSSGFQSGSNNGIQLPFAAGGPGHATTGGS